jgi:hypothetical protein
MGKIGLIILFKSYAHTPLINDSSHCAMCIQVYNKSWLDLARQRRVRELFFTQTKHTGKGEYLYKSNNPMCLRAVQTWLRG